MKDIVDNLLQFLAYGVTQSTETVLDSVVVFPAVTFCNLRPFDFGKEATVNSIQALIRDQYPNEISLKEKAKNSSVNQIMNFARANIRNNRVDVKGPINDTALFGLGFNWKHMVISCEFNQKECTEVDFYLSYSYEYGNCYTFNKKLSIY